MKKINLYIIYLMALIVSLSGCTPLVQVTADRQTNFNRYNTYSWLKDENNIQNPVFNNDLAIKLIKSTVEEEFSKRGIVKNASHPDFLVKLHSFTQEKQDMYGSNSAYYGYGLYPFPLGIYPYFSFFGNPWVWSGSNISSARTYNYTEGTLILDIVDSNSRELIWRGAIEGRLNKISFQKQVVKAAQAIMKKYPGFYQNHPEVKDAKQDPLS